MNKRHYTINSTQEITNVSFLKNFISPKPFYAHFIFGHRKLQLTSSTCLSVVFLLARWCNAIWLMLFYFSPRVKRLCYLLLQIFTSLFLPSYFLWTTKYSIFFFCFNISFSLASRIFPILQSPPEEILVWFGFHSLLLSFAPYSWRLFVKIHRESKHPCLHHKKQHKSLISKPRFGSWLPRIYGLNIPSEPYPFTNIHL